MTVDVTERHSQGGYVPGQSAQRVFDVHGSDTITEIAGATGLPVYGELYEDDATLSFLNVPRLERNGPMRWIVRIDYTPSPGAGNLDPVANLPARQRWTIGLAEVPNDRDDSGNAITNSSRNAFDPPPNRTVVTAILEVTRHEEMFDLAKSIRFIGSVNSDPFFLDGALVGDAGTALCIGFAPTGDYRSSDPLVEIRYAFEFRSGNTPWRLRIADFGTQAYGKDPEDPDKVVKAPIYTRASPPEPVSEPVPLNGRGRPYSADLYQVGRFDLEVPDPVLSPPSGATIEDTGEAAFLRYIDHPEIPFAELDL